MVEPTVSLTLPHILVIDDEPDLRTLYELSLVRNGYTVQSAGNVQEALAALQERTYDAVISDMRLPDGVGMDILHYISEQRRSERCVVMTAYGSPENAVDALKAGAFDYLTKPVDLKQFRIVVASAVQGTRSARLLLDHATIPPTTTHSTSAKPAPELATRTESPTIRAPNFGLITDAASQALSRIVGDSAIMQSVRERIAKVARSMAPVMVRGESGTGKELVARAVHACSHRAEGPFVAVNCSAIPESLLESEFFGARKGAYTGASQDRLGYFQTAHSGTLFLDEIGDLPIAMQAKLLRVIQERSVRPLGSTQEEPVDVRIVSATHHNLELAVGQANFRQDLFYRLNVIEIKLPALRDRRQDLPALCEALLERIAQESGTNPFHMPNALLKVLQAHTLAGNVRELENLLHRAVALSQDGDLALQEFISDPSDFKQPLDTPSEKLATTNDIECTNDLQKHLDDVERRILLRTLEECGFNRTLAATRLGLNLRQIRYRIERLHIHVPSMRSESIFTLSAADSRLSALN